MENMRIATALALLCAKQVNALSETAGSYYKVPTDDISAEDVQPKIEELYNYYYYSGPSVVFIIFVDVLIPIVCCIGITIAIVCIVKHVNRKRQRER